MAHRPARRRRPHRRTYRNYYRLTLRDRLAYWSARSTPRWILTALAVLVTLTLLLGLLLVGVLR